MQRIRIDTFADLLEHGYGLDCWCSGCRRWAHCNLLQLVAQGLGAHRAQQRRPRCRKCGKLGQWQVRPTVPKFDGPTWLQEQEPRR